MHVCVSVVQEVKYLNGFFGILYMWCQTGGIPRHSRRASSGSKENCSVDDLTSRRDVKNDACSKDEFDEGNVCDSSTIITLCSCVYHLYIATHLIVHLTVI
ncbi:hypothetical protein AVEN_100467-1, partial [Araneus ventricosus]